MINFLHVMTYQNSSPVQSITDQSTEKTIIEKDLEAGFGGVTNLLAYCVRYVYLHDRSENDGLKSDVY